MTLLACWAFAQDHSLTFDELAARAAAAREANDLARAIQLYNQALAIDPSWKEGLWFLGSLSYDTEQFAAGRDALQHFVSFDTSAAPGWALLGLCEFETSEYAGSLSHIQRALSLGVSNDQMTGVLRYHEALLLTRAGAFDQALRKYADFIHSAPANPEVLLGIGLAASREAKLPKDVSKADGEMLTAIGKAVFYTLSGELTNAEQIYRELLKTFPEASAVHYAYGVFLLGNDSSKAAAELKNALTISPSNAAAAAMLAWLYLQQSDAASALPYGVKATSGDPSSSLAQLVLGRSLVETGEMKRGIEHLEKAASLDPANLENHLALATAYSKAGRKQDAWKERQLSLESVSETAKVAQP